MFRTVALVFSTLLLASCGSAGDPEEDKPREGRAETQSIRNTEAIGYSGGAIADKVDSALTASEEYKKKQDEEIDDQLDEQ